MLSLKNDDDDDDADADDDDDINNNIVLQWSCTCTWNPCDFAPCEQQSHVTTGFKCQQSATTVTRRDKI